MSREKQIEEMAQCLCGWNKGTLCILDDKDCNLQCTYGKLANELTAKGYRKSTDLAEEIFAEIEEIFNKRIAFYTDMAKQSKFTEKHYAETMIKNCKIYLQEIAELKKKYTKSEEENE